MVNPKVSEMAPLTLSEVKDMLQMMQERDSELSYLSNKAREYVEILNLLDKKKREELKQKLLDLNLTRLKEEHICKIVDFLPKTADELKVVLQAYPLTMSKKDQDAIVGVVKEFI